jgi:hypothetical protein
VAHVSNRFGAPAREPLGGRFHPQHHALEGVSVVNRAPGLSYNLLESIKAQPKILEVEPVMHWGRGGAVQQKWVVVGDDRRQAAKMALASVRGR